MKATAANFLSLIKGPKQFVLPIYQRTYSWQIAHCKKLLADILRISRDESEPGHFIGSIVYFQESIHTLADVPQLLVIDGQQRLTTITLLITALAEFIKDNKVNLDTSDKKLQNYYLLNAEENDELRYRLLLTKSDKETLKNIVRGVKLQGDYSQKLWGNFEFLKKQITPESAIALYKGLQRLSVVEVALEKGKDNPQLIFESLNATRLNLSQADLIRNYILMGQDIPIQTELYEKYWYPMEQSYGNDYTTTFDRFIRDYLTVKTGQIPRIDEVYDAFKNYVQNNRSLKTLIDIVQDLFKFSKYYVHLALTKEPDRGLQQVFKNSAKLKVEVSYPFLLSVYDDYASGTITKDDFIKTVNYVANYIFRRAICGIPTNSLNKTFATLHKSLRKESYLESLQAAFQLMDGYKRFPTDAELEKEIVIKDLYNFRLRNYLLSNLENYNRKETINIDEYTIEHILPQNSDLSAAWQAMLGDNWREIQEIYVHTLGNLTLTGYNPKLSDRPFSEKKTIEGGFDDSPLRLNTYLRTVAVWNEAHIQSRARQLAAKAKDIWFAPKLLAETLAKYNPAEKRETSVYTIEHYEHLKGDMLELYFSLRKRILNIDSSVREIYKKLYIAFKSSTNFVDIVPRKAKLQLSLNIDFQSLIDPKGICKDVSDVGRWGNGDVQLSISVMEELDYTMELIQQAFDAQLEN